jgi:hypothetical protein
MNWIKCADELPPCDGKYEVTNRPNYKVTDIVVFLGPIEGILDYDGYGFRDSKQYYNPTHWRYYTPPSKKYGKQK